MNVLQWGVKLYEVVIVFEIAMEGNWDSWEIARMGVH